MRSIDRVRDAYGAVVARLVRFSIIGLAMVAVAMAATVGLAKITPTGFLPEDDQGALFVVAQLPGGSSVARTTEFVERAEAILKEEEAVGDVTSVIGLNFIDNYSQSNAAFMVVTLKPFEERKDQKPWRARTHCAAWAKNFAKFSGGTVVPLPPPPILGLGTGGGFTYVFEDLRGGDSKALDQALRGLHGRRQPGPEAQPRVQHVLGDQSLDLSRHRPRQGADPRRALERRLSVPAGLARRLLRQQHEFVRPHLAGAGAGRSSRSLQHR